MAVTNKVAIAGAVLAVLGACAPAPEPFAAKSLPKGEMLDIRSLLDQHQGRSVCVDHEAATDTCASVITAEFVGDRMVSRESGLVQLPEAGAAQLVEIMTRSTLRNGQACARPQDVSTDGRDEISGFLVEITRDLITQAGGSVCATYFRSGDHFVVSAMGADGRPFAHGDSYLQFVEGPVRLRVQ